MPDFSPAPMQLAQPGSHTAAITLAVPHGSAGELRCPCGTVKGHDHSAHRHNAGPAGNWRNYLPLFALVAVSVLAASALVRADGPAANATRWMHDFMGIFLIVFSLLKLFDLPGFADGFQRYDLLAKRLRPYALAYPFIELALGLGYLASWRPVAVYGATVIVLGFGALGVIRALRKGLDLECACMGTILKVPLSTVALTEDLGMAAMAAAMWLQLR